MGEMLETHPGNGWRVGDSIWIEQDCHGFMLIEENDGYRGVFSAFVQRH